jgi:hypothetical protein
VRKDLRARASCRGAARMSGVNGESNRGRRAVHAVWRDYIKRWIELRDARVNRCGYNVPWPALVPVWRRSRRPAVFARRMSDLARHALFVIARDVVADRTGVQGLAIRLRTHCAARLGADRRDRARVRIRMGERNRGRNQCARQPVLRSRKPCAHDHSPAEWNAVKTATPDSRQNGRPNGLSAVIYGGLQAVSRQKVLCPEQGCNTMLRGRFFDEPNVGNARLARETAICATTKEGRNERSRSVRTGLAARPELDP